MVFRLDHIPLVMTMYYSGVTFVHSCERNCLGLPILKNLTRTIGQSEEVSSLFLKFVIQLLSQPAPKFFHLHCLFVLFSFQQQKAFLVAYPHNESPLSFA